MKRIITLLTLLGAASTAHASLVVLSNLSAGGSTTGIPLSTTNWGAVGLTTSVEAVLFQSMAVYLNNAHPTNSFTVEGGIYSDSFGSPSSLLASFVTQNVPSQTASSVFTLVTATPLTLNASTDYWFVVHDAPFGLVWNTDGLGGGTTPDAEPGYAWLGYQQSSNAGSTWSSGSLYAAVEITVSSAAVPEPGTVVLLAGGLLAFACRLRVRRPASPQGSRS